MWVPLEDIPFNVRDSERFRNKTWREFHWAALCVEAINNRVARFRDRGKNAVSVRGNTATGYSVGWELVNVTLVVQVNSLYETRTLREIRPALRFTFTRTDHYNPCVYITWDLNSEILEVTTGQTGHLPYSIRVPEHVRAAIRVLERVEEKPWASTLSPYLGRHEQPPRVRLFLDESMSYWFSWTWFWPVLALIGSWLADPPSIPSRHSYLSLYPLLCNFLSPTLGALSALDVLNQQFWRWPLGEAKLRFINMFKPADFFRVTPGTSEANVRAKHLDVMCYVLNPDIDIRGRDLEYFPHTNVSFQWCGAFVHPSFGRMVEEILEGYGEWRWLQLSMHGRIAETLQSWRGDQPRLPSRSDSQPQPAQPQPAQPQPAQPQPAKPVDLSALPKRKIRKIRKG